MEGSAGDLGAKLLAYPKSNRPGSLNGNGSVSCPIDAYFSRFSKKIGDIRMKPRVSKKL